MVEFYPSVTTTDGRWREMIEEIDELGLTEVCFFPTCLSPEERREACELLGRTGVKRIPLVHLRTDMIPEEIKWFWDKYGTRRFNIHSQREYPLDFDLSGYRKAIFVETARVDLGTEPGGWAGVCPDFSHVENARLLGEERYQWHMKALEIYPRGVAHVNAIGSFRDGHYDWHRFERLEDFDYLRRYREFLPEICALELENPLAEQMEAREYLRKMR